MQVQTQEIADNSSKYPIMLARLEKKQKNRDNANYQHCRQKGHHMAEKDYFDDKVYIKFK